MARLHDRDLGDNLRPLSEISSYTIEKGDPDPRGHTVISGDGRRIGEVEDLIVDTSAMKVRYLVVDLDKHAARGDLSSGSVLLSPDDVELRGDSHQVIARSYTGREAAYTRGPSHAAASAERDRTSDHRRTLTRTEEELHVDKREVNRGEVRVGKHVETEHVSQPVSRRRDEVVVERRPVEGGARAQADISEDEIRMPITEEELVVEKRPVVKEELVIGKRTVEEQDTVEADLRKEKFDIDKDTHVTSRMRGRGDDR